MASEPLGCVISFRRGGVDARGGDLRIVLHCLRIERLVSAIVFAGIGIIIGNVRSYRQGLAIP